MIDALNQGWDVQDSFQDRIVIQKERITVKKGQIYSYLIGEMPDMLVLTHLSIENRYSREDNQWRLDPVESYLVVPARAVDTPIQIAHLEPLGHMSHSYIWQHKQWWVTISFWRSKYSLPINVLELYITDLPNYTNLISLLSSLSLLLFSCLFLTIFYLRNHRVFLDVLLSNKKKSFISRQSSKQVRSRQKLNSYYRGIISKSLTNPPKQTSQLMRHLKTAKSISIVMVT